MADPKYNFQFCQKIILFSTDWRRVLLARRYGEADYDGVFSFIGGKMETTDETLLDGLRREKDVEIGGEARIRVYLGATHNLLYRKKDGGAMVLPHYLAQYDSGEIHLLPEEYSEYRWVKVDELDGLEPKIETIPDCARWALAMRAMISAEDLVEI